MTRKTPDEIRAAKGQTDWDNLADQPDHEGPPEVAVDMDQGEVAGAVDAHQPDQPGPCRYCHDGGEPRCCEQTEGVYKVHCFACYASGPERRTKAAAIAAWDYRPRVKPLDWVRVSEREYQALTMQSGGTYTVFKSHGRWYWVGDVGDAVDGHYGGKKRRKAMARAQAHWERSLAACYEPQKEGE